METNNSRYAVRCRNLNSIAYRFPASFVIKLDRSRSGRPKDYTAPVSKPRKLSAQWWR
jgi:hypothetical protein